jgi:hypothetical protein
MLKFSLAVLVSIATLYPLASIAQGKAPYSKKQLLDALKENERDRRLTTQDFVRYIDQRGVDFELTASDESDLRQAGAVPEIISAISRNYREPPLPKGSGSVTIYSELPDCQVYINGQLRGSTSASGRLRLRPLKAGQYNVVLRKDKYEDQQRSISISSGNETSERFSLTPLKGSLTALPNVSGAKVYVAGTEYADGVRNLVLAPGEYEVKGTKSGYKTFSTSVRIGPGQPVNVPVTLEVIKVDELSARAMESFRVRDFPRVIQFAKDILEVQPDDPKANLLLGLGYFHNQNYDAAVPPLIKATSLGEQVSIPLQHHTKYGFVNDNLTPGNLLIGKNLLEFRTQAGVKLFSVPFDKLFRVIAEDNRGGRLQMKVGNPSKPKDSGKDFNFHPMQARLQQEVVGTSRVLKIYCNDCVPSVHAIYQVLEQMRQGVAQSPAPAKP